VVLYVGDKPNPRISTSNLAFVGTQSGRTLKKWHSQIDTSWDLYLAVNSVDLTPSILSVAYRYNLKIIALGNNASKALGKVPHFKLPHPSGKNRKLNDKKWLAEQLEAARMYVEAL
jgi:uracil-DNA glycosylase